MRVFLALAMMSMLFAACSGPDDQQETAYNEGYAFGYSRDCEATLANVDTDLFEDADYAREFARGRREGEAVCTILRAANPRAMRTQ